MRGLGKEDESLYEAIDITDQVPTRKVTKTFPINAFNKQKADILIKYPNVETIEIGLPLPGGQRKVIQYRKKNTNVPPTEPKQKSPMDELMKSCTIVSPKPLVEDI